MPALPCAGLVPVIYRRELIILSADKFFFHYGQPMHTISKRPVRLLCFVLSLIASGCAQQPRNVVQPVQLPVSENALTPSPGTFQQSYRGFAPNSQTAAAPDSQPAVFDTLWQRLFSLYSLPEISNPRIDREIERYLQHPEYLITIQERAKPYLYNILEEIEAKKLPGELALLPVVESAFKPQAHSSSNASGLWQFMPATGRLLGLEQNWWYDGRQDVFASTQAATTYLQQLNETFDGDWLLTLAAYNAGKGTVLKAMEKNRKKNQPLDYWSLPLPLETRRYVPRLLAIAKIFANADAYAVELLPIANEPTFASIDIGSQLDLALAAEMANMPIDDFVQLNPGFKRWCTAPSGPHRVLVPVAKAESFKSTLAQLPAAKRMQWQRHKIKRGENLSLIAKKYQTSTTAIRHANQLSSDRIRAGQALLIPLSSLGTYHERPFTGRARHTGSRQQKVIYKVRKGDTFWDIARKYSVKSTDIARWNHLHTSSTLHPGQRLVIKSGKTRHNQPVHYTVKKGDSLFKISRKFGVSIADLHKWNQHSMGKFLHPGQKLHIRIASASPST